MKKLSLIFSVFILTVINLYAADYYWVGGSGNWSDFANHWATTSGGSTFYTQAPTLNDNVFFNAASFPSGGAIVTIDVDATCASMNWTGATNNPQLAGAAARMLNIYGSLILINEINYNYQGSVTFRSSSFGNTITMAGKSYLNNVVFEGIGSWTLQDAMTLPGHDLYFVNGTLNTNGHNVSMRLFRSEYTSNRTLNLGSSTFTCWHNSSSAWRSNGNNFTVNPGTSNIVFSAAGGGLENYNAGINLYDVTLTATGGTGYYRNTGPAHHLTFNANGYMYQSWSAIEKVSITGHADILNGSYNIAELILNSTATIHQGGNTLGSVQMKGNATVNGNNEFGTLELWPGKTYTFQSAVTQTFTGNLIAVGNCFEPINIQSSSAGSQAIFSKSGGSITIDFISLKDNTAMGGATFTANNTIDAGNNTGWTINSPSTTNLYWVGGSGNWNDPSHWSYSSAGVGGTGGACLPTMVDNVIFDAYSFTAPGQTVTLVPDGNNNVNVRNMTWTGVTNNPTLSGASNVNLRIYGSLTLASGMTYSHAGDVYFNSNAAGNTITSAGKTYPRYVTFDGVGGEWTLQDAMTLSSLDLYLVNGTLNTNGLNVSMRLFRSEYTTNRTLNLGSSTFTCWHNSSTAWRSNGNNFTVNPGTSSIVFSAAGGGLENYNAGINLYDVTFTATGGTGYYRNTGPANHLTFNANGYMYQSWSAIEKVSITGHADILNGSYNIAELVLNSTATIHQGNNTFGSVQMKGNATVNGNNEFGTLELWPGKTYTFQSGVTQTFTGNLVAVGNCFEPINIQSSSAGSQATFSKSGGNITISYISLKDNNATGGATFTANNTIDAGNNTGWTINSPSTTNLYWVGGSGNWNDPSHWSYSSAGVGGTGGACLPTMVDNVIFDAYSFTAPGQTVTLVPDGNNNVNVRNMTWTGVTNNPTLSGASNVNLRIYGSLTLASGMTYSHAGDVYFNSNAAGDTITSAGKTYPRYVTFDGVGGEWTLQDAMTLSSLDLYLVNGTLNTNGLNVSMRLFRSEYTTNRTLNLGSSTFTCWHNSSTAWRSNGNNFTVNPGTSSIVFSAAGGGLENYNAGINLYDVTFTATGGTGYYRNTGPANHLTFNANGYMYQSWSAIEKVSITGHADILNGSYNIAELVLNSTATIHQGNNTFGSVQMKGNATVNGNNEFGTLELWPGKTYTFQSGVTQTFTGNLVAVGNCFEPINIQSSSAGSQATFSKSGGNITISYISLKDNNATGGATFTANNTIDAGNNTGWTINSPSTTNLYWVGGSGNWNDPSHWSYSSAGVGGTGGACLPTMVDNVIFDAYSFTAPGQTVTLVPDGNNNVNVRNMTWTGVTNNPTLSGASNVNLRIYGSLTLASGMTYSHAGDVYFNSNAAGNTITSAGKTYPRYVTFDGVGGEWTLQDAMTLSSLDLYLVNGTLNTNGLNVSMRLFRSEYTTNRTLNLGSSTFTCWHNSSTAWRSNGNNFTVNPGTSSIVFSAAGGGLENYNAGINLYDVTFTATGGTGYYRNTGPAHHLTFNANGYMYQSWSAIEKVSITGHADILNGSYNIAELVLNSTATIHQGGNTFGSVQMKGNATVNGNNEFGTLELWPGKTYTFQSGVTQTFTGNLIANGTCSEAITIQASSAGTRANFSKASGTVTINRVNLKDNNATGGATFIANNCNDLGNNLGWTINALAGQDLYWIGNAGNWDDGSHWSLTSGGAPSFCTSTKLDNLFFDVNSFTSPGQVVSVNVANAECMNMNWTGVLNSPAFSALSSSYNLKVNGSLTLSPNMNFAFNGNTYFEAEVPGSYSIKMEGKIFNNAVYFNGAGNTWTLQDNLAINNNDLYLNKGALNTNGKNVTCRRFISTTSDTRALNMGASLFSLGSNSNQAWYVSGSNMSITPGTSEIRFGSAGAGLWSQTPTALNYNDVTFEGTTGVSSISGSAVFGKVIFAGNGTINGNHTYNTLIFSPGKSYTLESGKTQTILNKFHAWVNDGSQINMQASTSGLQATISKASGTVWANRAQLKDMKAIGGATFNVYNGTNLGNNTGWNFLAPTYYNQTANINVPNGQSECLEATEIITVGGDGKTFVVQNGGEARLIAGYKVRMLPGVRVYSSGKLHARISQYGEFCALEANMLASLEEENSENLIVPDDADEIIIYPNPTTGWFKVQGSKFKVEKSRIEILDINGKAMLFLNLEPGTLNQELDISLLPPGVYFCRIQNNEEIIVKKLIKL